MQAKFERMEFLTSTMIKFHRKICNFTERVSMITLTRKLQEDLLRHQFQPKMRKVELVEKDEGEKGVSNQIYSYLFTSKSKQDLHNNILIQKVLCIIRKYLDFCSATSDYSCKL